MSNVWRVQDPGGTLVRVVQGGAAAMVESHFLCQSYSPPPQPPEPAYPALLRQIEEAVHQAPGFKRFVEIRGRIAALTKELREVERQCVENEQKRKTAQAALGTERERQDLIGLRENHPRLQKGITNLLALAQADRDGPILQQRMANLEQEIATLAAQLPEARDEAEAECDAEATRVRQQATPAPRSRATIEEELCKVSGPLLSELVDAIVTIVTRDRGPDVRPLQRAAREKLLGEPAQ